VENLVVEPILDIINIAEIKYFEL